MTLERGTIQLLPTARTTEEGFGSGYVALHTGTPEAGGSRTPDLPRLPGSWIYMSVCGTLDHDLASRVNRGRLIILRNRRSHTDQVAIKQLLSYPKTEGYHKQQVLKRGKREIEVQVQV